MTDSTKETVMFSPDREVLSFRTLAIAPIVLFIPTLILGVALPGSKIGAALGVLFHLSVLLVVSRMPAPAWARAAGFAWLALDITSGSMTLNNVPYDIAFPVRLGGHVLAGVWLVTVSLLSKPRSVRALGIIVGLWLAVYTFFGSVLPVILLAPPGILVVVWFALLAWHFKTTPTSDPVGPPILLTGTRFGSAVGGGGVCSRSSSCRGGVVRVRAVQGPRSA